MDLAEPSAEAPDPSRLAELEENIDILGHALARGGEATGENPFDLPPDVRTPVVVRMRQVHGADVHTVDRSWLESRHEQPAVADGLATDLPGVALLVRVADCVPVLLADPEQGLVAAVHAGRPGLVAGVVPRALAALRDLGARRLVAWVGPHVCGGCYEVPEQMRSEVAAVVPEAYAETSWGTPAVDIGAGVVAQLRAADGLEAPVELVEVGRCTLEDDDLFSYRRQGSESGRLAGVVRVRS